jgi:hypothetical protein
MSIRRWLQEVGLPTLKNVWQRSREKWGVKSESRLFQHNDLTNPLHPFNVGQREMDDYNDRRAREALHDHLQDSQRFQEHHRHYD